jgi:hypothetical protein
MTSSVSGLTSGSFCSGLASWLTRSWLSLSGCIGPGASSLLGAGGATASGASSTRTTGAPATTSASGVRDAIANAKSPCAASTMAAHPPQR